MISSSFEGRRTGRGALFVGASAVSAVVLPLAAWALPQLSVAADGGFCSATASAQHVACRAEGRDDFFVAKANCTNVADAAERDACLQEALAARAEGARSCGEQLRARRALCEQVGEARYDPDLDPADFDSDYTNLTHPNPFVPLTIGNRWEYDEDGDPVRIEILDSTKSIEGVTCIVVRDTVFANGSVHEDTDDWFAQAKNGDVWYFGEEVKDYETFPGDLPQAPELVSIDGSFKAGRDGAKPGIRFPASPIVGQVYRQEFSPGNAEDAAEILTTTYAFGSNPELDQLVPQDLAELLCSDDCVVTKEGTPIEPDVIEIKYHAPGIGTFFEVNTTTGTKVQLVDCNFDPRCAALPVP